MRPDPRHMLVHEGLAGVDLEGVVRAEWFVAPAIKAVTAPWLALHKAPAANAEQVSQLLFGERFDVLTEQDGFAFGQGARDGYVGWAAAEGLGAPGPPPTHWVSAPMTVILSEPRVRSAAVGSYPFGALVTANGREGSFTRIEGAGWAPARHLNNVGHTLGDWAATAELFLGAPYLWGGRTASGLD
ncbi:MAG: peptidoglycan endopeptidase, partial [Caulobacteraceae bacterium]|nr:peptidoglycan endopeptidase [Caulobacteraceae bacterium]